MSLNVLMLSWEFPPFKVGGLAAHVYDLSKMLVKKGHTIHVVTCSFPGAADYELVDGVHVHRFDAYEIPAPEFLQWDLNMNVLMEKKAIEIISEHDIDIIFVTSNNLTGLESFDGHFVIFNYPYFISTHCNHITRSLGG